MHDTDSLPALVEISDLRVTLGRSNVLRGVDFVAPRGIVALLGPNGAGKTTLLRVLTTLVRPNAGTARILDHDVVTQARAVRRLVRVTGQSTTVDEALTGRENLVLFGRLLGLSRRRARARAVELLDQFNLGDAAARRAGTYSGGMRRRLDLAVGLVDSPRVLVLDEPTTGLDPASRAALWGALRELRDAGTSIVLTTQILTEAEALADLVAVLHEGRIVATGTPAALASRVGAETVRLLRDDGGVARATASDGTVRDLLRVLGDCEASELDLRVELDRPTLDDAFAALTTGARQ